MGADYKVRYAKSVLEFMRTEIQTRKAYDRVDSYRTILASFPEVGAVYDPYYEAARPPMECRYITVRGTPFTLYYAMGERAKTVSKEADEQVSRVALHHCSAAGRKRVR